MPTPSKTLYECPRCGYLTYSASNFKYHLHRQVSCEDSKQSGLSISSLRAEREQKIAARSAKACGKCGVPFSSKRMKSYHIRHCPADRPSTSSNVPSVPSVSTITTEQPVSIDVSGNHNTVTNNTTNNNTNNVTNHFNINVVIRPMGEENMAHILGDKQALETFVYDRILTRLHDIDGIKEYLDKKHFDNAHPENRNIQKQDDTFVAWDGDEWTPYPSEDELTSESLINTNSDIEGVVNESITRAAPIVANKRRRILNDWMLEGPGAALQFGFPNAGIEGLPRGHSRRAPTTTLAADRAKDAETRNELYRVLSQYWQDRLSAPRDP